MDPQTSMRLKGYREFVDEKFGELFKVYFAYKGKAEDEGFSFKEYMCKNFALPLVEKKLDYQINQKYPIINYNSDLIKYLIKNKIIKSDNVYNHPDYTIDVASKVKFHELMQESKFVPKTVFTKEDAMKLKFPVIAKPDNNHSGMGIKKFKNKLELENSEDKFDVYSECKKIKEEHRMIFFKETPILFMLRQPMNKKAKGEGGSTEEAMVFDYKKMNVDYVPSELDELLKEVRAKFPKVDFYALDIMEDEDGDSYIIEINSQPGLPFDSTVKLYGAVYNDYFKNKLTQRGEYQLSVFATDLDEITTRSDNRFIKGK